MAVHGRRAKVFEHFASDVSLEATDDFFFGKALGGSAREVCACPVIATNAGESNDSQRTIGITIATSIQSMAMLSTRRCVHR